MGTEKILAFIATRSESFALGSYCPTANATWCLTDYTEEDGALAYVPGSHNYNAHPDRRREIKLCQPFAPRAL